MKKTPAKESVSVSAKKTVEDAVTAKCTDYVSAKETPHSTPLKSVNNNEKKTPSKEDVSTEDAGKERRGDNDVGEVTVNNEHI